MYIVRMALAALVLGCALLPAQAHHSAAMYDFRKVEEATGVVKAVRVINPHMSLTLEVGDAKGAKDVEFEGHSLNNFYRAGWRPNMIKVGDKIKVRFAPRQGPGAGRLRQRFRDLRWPGGRVQDSHRSQCAGAAPRPGQWQQVNTEYGLSVKAGRDVARE